jgi:CDP-diacylglycerol--serine O-phosphatidyltransferase
MTTMTRNRRFRRGIYLLPSLFTIGNLFCGYSSIIHSSQGSFRLAALLLVVAGLLDGLDGRIARLTGTTSEFGLQFDSLADVVSFGVAPAVLVYHWALTPFERTGWLVAFLFVICTSMRLARFNIRSASTDKRFFVGLPSPAAAGAVSSVPFVFPINPDPEWVGPAMTGFTVGVALLMVSRFRYRSFKDFDLRNRRSYIQILPIAAIFVGLFSQPEVLLALAAWYLLSGPAAYAWGLTRRGRRNRVVLASEGDGTTEVVDGPAFR